MAINPDYVGRTFEPSEPYEVSRVKIAEFADAIGEPSPLCRDRSAARAAERMISSCPCGQDRPMPRWAVSIASATANP